MDVTRRDQDDDFNGGRCPKPPEIPSDPMEFLCRSWSVSAMEVSRALAPPFPSAAPADMAGAIPDEVDETAAAFAGNNFSFASSATSQLVLQMIMSQSEATPLTSGRLSHSSVPLNGGQSAIGSISDSPPFSPSDLEDAYYYRAITAARPHRHRGGTTKTVGRWLKDRREKKKDADRAHNAQLHAAVSVAGAAAAVAAITAATAFASSNGKDARAASADLAVASAARLVAAQCVEAAEAMGARREHLVSVVGSAACVRTPGDIAALTAAAATALRGSAALRARALKDAWSVAAVIPVEKWGHYNHAQLQRTYSECSGGGGGGGFSGLEAEEKLLARGTELLKRTRKGALHWKLVYVYIDQSGQVMLKTKSSHVAGAFTKKKKSVITDICKDFPAWPGRHLLEGVEHRRYVGLLTAEHRVIEFEFRGQREHEMWARGVSRLLAMANGGNGIGETLI